MSKDKVLLLCFITDYWFDKNVTELLNWMNNLTNSSQDKVNVITLILNFLQTVTLAHTFLLKVDLEVLDKSPGQASQFGNIPYKEIYFLLAGGQLGFRDYIDICLAMEFNNLAGSFCRNSCIISSLFSGITLKSEISVPIDCFRVLEFICSLWLNNDFECSWHNKIEPFADISLLVQKITLLKILWFMWNHELHSK